MLSTERRRHDVHVLFGDVIYDVRNAHWRENNEIKRKFTLFSVNIIKKFSSHVMKTFKFSLVLRTRENIDVFITLDDNIYGIHSKRVNILYLTIEPRHSIYCYIGCAPVKTQICLDNSEQHSQSTLWVAKNSKCLQADSKDSGQHARKLI